MDSTRSKEDVAAGLLRIAIAGSIREVPTLKAKWVGAWTALFAEEVQEPKAIGGWTVADAMQFSSRSVAQLLDLVVAYDRTVALGGREWLEENADPAQLRAALIQMTGNAFPLADPAVLVDMTLARTAAASIPPSSMNGASPTGTSPRTTSGRSSTRSR